MLEQAKPASREVKSKKDLEIFLKHQMEPVLITSTSAPSSSVYVLHDTLANAGRESPLTFAHTFNTEVVSTLGLQLESSAILTPERSVTLENVRYTPCYRHAQVI